jgi:hypothetical protein
MYQTMQIENRTLSYAIDEIERRRGSNGGQSDALRQCCVRLGDKRAQSALLLITRRRRSTTSSSSSTTTGEGDDEAGANNSGHKARVGATLLCAALRGAGVDQLHALLTGVKRQREVLRTGTIVAGVGTIVG